MFSTHLFSTQLWGIHNLMYCIASINVRHWKLELWKHWLMQRAKIAEIQFSDRVRPLLHVCEIELTWLDMPINIDKLCCLRIGTRFNYYYCSVLTVSGLHAVG